MRKMTVIFMRRTTRIRWRNRRSACSGRLSWLVRSFVGAMLRSGRISQASSGEAE